MSFVLCVFLSWWQVLRSVPCIVPPGTPPAAQAQVKTIVFIPGYDTHGVGEHEYLGGSLLLARLLNQQVPGVHAIVGKQGWPPDTTILDTADAIVIFSSGGDEHLALPHLKHLDKLMDKKVWDWSPSIGPWKCRRVRAGDYFLKWLGGYFELNWSVNPMWTAEFHDLPTHPITNGVPPFVAADEWYYHMRFRENDPHVIPILQALPPDYTLAGPDGERSGNAAVRKAVLVDKQPQTVAWAYTRPNGGRGFGFTGVHVHDNWMNDDFRKLILNAIVWSAHSPVPENGVVTPRRRK